MATALRHQVDFLGKKTQIPVGVNGDEFDWIVGREVIS